MARHVVWLRNDLRITDNLALVHACEDPTAQVIAIYIATPIQWQQHNLSPRQAGLIFNALVTVQKELASRAIPLLYHQSESFTDAAKWLVDYCQTQGIDKLFFNKQYELNERQRDQWVIQQLVGCVACYDFDDSVLLPPNSVVTKKGEMYRVFTPFRQAFMQRLMAKIPVSLPAPSPRNGIFPVISTTIAPFDYPQQQQTLFAASEYAAIAELRRFCRQHVADYKNQRDYPAKAGTSQLSAYLVLGLLSPRQCINCLQIEHPHFWQQPESGAFCWFNELIWRDFYRHLLVAFPALCKHRPFMAWTDNVVWQNHPHMFESWQQGKTGYPIVDAAMRQLLHTGWMHNRLRMIVASFLVKNLLIDWRLGERYFMTQLTDGDLAANNGGWQWAASTGTDSTPYFRIFNPTTQGKRFDAEGTFIRSWLPELAQVSNEWLHEPHRWAERENVILDYPLPIVDHAAARQRTLSAFAAAKLPQNL